MSRIEKWYTGQLSYSSIINNNKPFAFPLLTRIFDNKDMRHFDKMDHFNLITIILSNRIMNADHFRDGREIDFVYDFYEKFFSKEKAESAIFLLNQYLEHPYVETFYSDFLEEISWQLSSSYKSQLVYYMFELAGADETIDKQEINELFKIAQAIGVSRKEINRISALYISGYIPYPEKPKSSSKSRSRRNSSSDDRKYGTRHRYTKKKKKTASSTRRRARPSSYKLKISFQVLGLTLHASVAQIKAAYRRLAKANHPDQFISLGQLHVKKATEKMARINRAYEYIQSVKRFN